MDIELIHIVPFDMGISFSNYEETKRYSKTQFISDLREKLAYVKYEITEKDNYLCVINISDKIECRLFDYGIGVFVLKNLSSNESNNEWGVFENEIACQAYYKKKKEQKMILKNESNEIHPIFSVIENIWSLKKNGVRSYSSNSAYKGNGISYVLTIYHITGYENEKGDKQLDLLMNPAGLSNILEKERWESIKRLADSYEEKGYREESINETSKVIASWSGVALVEKNNTHVIDRLIKYEVSLQSAWFLFDALIDNLENSKLTDMELQRCKSTATNVYLDAGSIISANMGTNEKRYMEIIYDSSDLEITKEKCFLLLENRIALEKARLNNRQTIYGIITEILLVAFTIIQIYDPVRNFINGSLSRSDIIIGIVMFVVLIISSILIIRKDK